jgi:hypothetical protein
MAIPSSTSIRNLNTPNKSLSFRPNDNKIDQFLRKIIFQSLERSTDQFLFQRATSLPTVAFFAQGASVNNNVAAVSTTTLTLERVGQHVAIDSLMNSALAVIMTSAFLNSNNKFVPPNSLSYACSAPNSSPAAPEATKSSASNAKSLPIPMVLISALQTLSTSTTCIVPRTLAVLPMILSALTADDALSPTNVLCDKSCTYSIMPDSISNSVMTKTSKPKFLSSSASLGSSPMPFLPPADHPIPPTSMSFP